MQRYEKYKDSGIDWLGEIPEYWVTRPNKYVFQLVKNQVGKRSSEYDLLSLTLRGIVKRDMENPEGKFPAEFDTYQEVKVNDFVFCLFDVEETPRTVGLSSFDGMITGAYTVMKPLKGVHAPFMYYYYLNADDKKQLKYLYRGLRNTIPKDSFSSLKSIIPPIHEQKAIANYLDDKCEKIDAAINLKEQQIEKLKELRQITIHNAVTKGISLSTGKAVRMKDSGIDWIGEIPEYWEVKRLKNVLIERNERSQSGTEPLFMMSQIHGLVLRKDYHEKEEVAKSAEGNKVVYQNDLVFNKLKPHLGVFYKNKLDTMGIVSPDYAVYYSDTLDDIIFLEYLFRIPEYISQFKIRATGIVEGLIRLYTSDLFSIHVAIPPLSEQREIITYLENQISKIDKAIAQKQEQIIKLKEYKQSLINEVVTGKLKVVD